MNRKFTLVVIVFGLGVFLGGCGKLMTSSEDIVKVQVQYEAQLMSLPGVHGVGIGECNGQPCLKVYVEQKTPELERQIPEQLEGFKVDIEVTGPFEALPASGSSPTSSGDIVKVQAQYEAQLMSLPGVHGVGIGECNGQPCLKVYVEQKTPELERQIPEQLEGFKVDIEVTGPFQIQPK